MTLRRTTIIILGSIIAAACYTSAIDYSKHGPIVDPELEPYVWEWVSDCKAYHKNYLMNFNSVRSIQLVDEFPDQGFLTNLLIDHDAIGFTNGWTGDVYIKRMQSKELTRAIVYHELGHAVFDYQHVESSGHIMSSVMEIGNSSYYSDNWASLVSSYYSRK